MQQTTVLHRSKNGNGRSSRSSDSDGLASLRSMMEQLPVNVMFADRDFIIRYMNEASRKTLKSIERLLPVKAENVVGQSLDIFHKQPERVRQILSDPPTCRTGVRSLSARKFWSKS